MSPLKSFLKPAGLDNQAKDQLVSVGEADFVGGALLLSKIGEESGGREGGGSSFSAWEVLLGEESLPPFIGLGMGSP